MNREIIVRKAVPQDTTGIAIVRAYTWTTAYKGLLPDEILQKRIESVDSNAARLKNLIAGGNFIYAVAVHNNAVVGFVSFGESRNEDYPYDGEVVALYVLKGFAGQGTGRKLLEYAENRLKVTGYKNMIVNCLEGNPSVEFYKKMGGRIAGKRTDEINGGYVIKEYILRFEL